MVPKAASASKKRKKKRQKGTKQWIGQLVWRKGGKLFLAFWHFHEPDLWYSAFNAFMRVISLFLIAKIREGILFYVHQCNAMIWKSSIRPWTKHMWEDSIYHILISNCLRWIDTRGQKATHYYPLSMKIIPTYSSSYMLQSLVTTQWLLGHYLSIQAVGYLQLDLLFL